MREKIHEVRKYAKRNHPTDQELLTNMQLAQLQGTKTEACGAVEIRKLNGRSYRYHRGYWTAGAGYTTLPSIWPA